MGEFYLGGKTSDWPHTGGRWRKGGGGEVKPPVKDPQNAKTSCFAAESCQKMFQPSKNVGLGFWALTFNVDPDFGF